MKIQELFGQNLRILRMEQGLTQQQLADLVFVTRKTVGNWESGNRMPDLVMLSRLAAALQMEPGALLDAAQVRVEPPRIIVVEDLPVILKGLVQTVEEELPETEVHGFRTGTEALEYARTNRVAVAFLDIELSGENGIDLSQQLKEIEARTNIIFLTCHPEYVHEAVNNHCSGYILKPLTPEKLHREIAHLCFPVRGLKA